MPSWEYREAGGEPPRSCNTNGGAGGIEVMQLVVTLWDRNSSAVSVISSSRLKAVRQACGLGLDLRPYRVIGRPNNMDSEEAP